jgi:hypothetical protein
MTDMPTTGKRLLDLADKVSAVHGPDVSRVSIGETQTADAQHAYLNTPILPPILSPKAPSLLKQWKSGDASIILDLEPLELARQLTIKVSRIFCSIQPMELLNTEWTREPGSLAVNVRAMSTLSADLRYWVSDTIRSLDEPKKRAATIEHWVKIANKCLELNNYDSLEIIVSSLVTSISQLEHIWRIVSQKTKTTLEHLRRIRISDMLENHVPPCLPCIGTYLTELAYIDYRDESVDFLRFYPEETDLDKSTRTAQIINEHQRFQVPYRLTEVPRLQTWLQSELVRVRPKETDSQTLYRQSLGVEL